METRDYSKFKFLKTNRDINKSTVNKLVESIKEWGIIPGRPILVDGDYNIIDGQHRFVAIKQLGHPIPYEVINGDVIKKTMALNSSQQQWKLIDYIKSYSEQGMDCYRKLLKFEEKYKYGITSSINICLQSKTKADSIRKGKIFEIAPDSEDIANYIESLKELPFYNKKEFITAIITLHKKANPKQLNIIKTNILRVQRFSTTSDYLTCFENILNFKKRGNNIIKL